MAAIDDGEIFVEIPAASRNELEAALAAARRVFALGGVAVFDAYQAYQLTRGADWNLTPEEWRQGNIFDDAWRAAEAAATGHVGQEPDWIYVGPVGADSEGSTLRMEKDQPHYRMRELEPLPELPLGLPPLDSRILDPRIAA